MKEIWCPLEDMEKERLWYAIVTRDRYGKIVARERRKSHSFLKAWNQIVYVQMSRVNLAGTKDTGGVARTLSIHENNFIIAVGIGSTIIGIRVGTGDTPVDIADFAMETPIEQGVAAGQMEHLACTVAVPVVAAPSCSSLVSRTISNNSGGVITVREAGIYLRGATYFFCGTRDVLIAPQAVPNGGGITIDWTIGVTE